MTIDVARQTEEFLKAAREARIPEGVQAIAEDTLTKTREAYGRMSAVMKDGARAAEDVFLASHAGARVIGEKVLSNTAVNTEAAFEAAQAMARAKTLAEVAQLQASFMQRQMAMAGEQTKELFELSTRVAKQTFDTFGAAAAKSVDRMKAAS